MATNDIMSSYLETALLNHILKGTAYTPPTAIYIGLYTVEPGKSDTGTEVSGGGYIPVLCPAFTISASSAYSSTVIEFPLVTSPWGTVSYMGLRDQTGNLLFYGDLSSVITPVAQNIVRVSPYLSVSLSGNEDMGWGATIPTTILDFIFNEASYSPTSALYLALGRSVVWNNVYNLASWTEVGSSGYSRQRVSGSAWDTITSGGTRLVGDPVVFTTSAPANWGVISHIALYDQASGGNVILWGKLSPQRLVTTGDGVRFLSGSITLRLHLPPAPGGVFD